MKQRSVCSDGRRERGVDKKGYEKETIGWETIETATLQLLFYLGE